MQWPTSIIYLVLFFLSISINSHPHKVKYAFNPNWGIETTTRVMNSCDHWYSYVIPKGIALFCLRWINRYRYQRLFGNQSISLCIFILITRLGFLVYENLMINFYQFMFMALSTKSRRSWERWWKWFIKVLVSDTDTFLFFKWKGRSQNVDLLGHQLFL